jgi:protein-disulfide isomerase
MFAIVLAAIWMASVAAHAQQARPSAAFTPAQRAEIVEILRAALKSDPSILRDAVMAMQADETQRQEAAGQAAIAGAADALTRTEGDPVGGNPQGRVVVVEFYDVRCPYCRRMLPVEAELLRKNPDLRVIYKDIPILGPGSVIGARALLAAQRQDGYARLRAALMGGPAEVTTQGVQAAAEHLGLDWPKLQRDMDDPAVTARIDANLALAHKLDIQGTPAYVVGGRMIPGAVELGELQAAVAGARAALR